MVHHIVMWNFKPEIAEEQKPALKAAMAEHLESLTGKIPGLISLKFISDPVSSSTHDMALVSTFEKAGDIAVYAQHPEHVKVADHYVRPYVCQRSCLDYE